MHLDREIELLKAKTLSLAARVEESLRNALKSVRDRDTELGMKVIDGDEVIDQMEVALEEECLKALALYQPVASDLRFIVAVIKVTGELERIGDLAVDIAERGVYLTDHPPEPMPAQLGNEATKVQAMVKKTLDSFVNLDPDLAREVCRSDDEVDMLHKGMFEVVQKWMHESPEKIEIWLPLLSISRYLERIADHATNIAEDVIYMAEGRIVRHVSEIPPEARHPSEGSR